MVTEKTIHDPVHGSMRVGGLALDLVDTPEIQRLRRIRQLGLANLVFPGANHTRFQHSLGAAYLMIETLQSLHSKGVEVTEQEALAALAAILLHDIGHGPFSHTLERSFVKMVKLTGKN